MPLQIYDSQDAVPEEAREVALALADGRYAVEQPEDIEGLKKNTAKLIAEKREADRKAKEATARLAELERAAAAKDAGLNSEQLAKLRESVQADYAPIVAERDTLKAKVRALTLDTAVQSEMAKAGVRGDRIALLWKTVQDEFDLTDEGEPYVRSAPTKTIAQYIAGDLRQAVPEFFAGTGASGGGATGSRGAAPAKTISRSDTRAFLANLDGIAKGDVAVVD
jgi:hypothetical protein